MVEDEDWKLWRQAINPMATDFLRIALEDREEFFRETDPTRRKRLARGVMAGFLRAAEAMGADEISTLAYSADLSEDSTHADHLRGLAQRIDFLSEPFHLRDSSDYPYSPKAVATELRYMAAGDPPRALRPSLKEANKSAQRREVEHWARALEWVQFLSQANKRISDCQWAVSRAYGGRLDGVRKDWRPRVAEILGAEAIERIDRAAHRVPADFRFSTVEEGLAALRADGGAYVDLIQRRDGVVVPIKGN